MLVALSAVGSLLIWAALAASAGSIVVNGTAEVGPVATDDANVVAPQGWTTTGSFTGVRYGSSGVPGIDASAAIHGGVSMFAGGPNNASSAAWQSVKLPAVWVKAVAAGRGNARFTAALGGWEGQPDAATVTYLFQDGGGATVGSIRLGPVTPQMRVNVTKLIAVSKTAVVPASTRSVKVTITAIRGSGAYNDGYADNVGMTLVG
ncbi:MAG: hypothetical protein WCH31_03050 [Actinomycetes bacterium]